jgi:hypothetical protein
MCTMNFLPVLRRKCWVRMFDEGSQWIEIDALLSLVTLLCRLLVNYFFLVLINNIRQQIPAINSITCNTKVQSKLLQSIINGATANRSGNVVINPAQRANRLFIIRNTQIAVYTIPNASARMKFGSEGSRIARTRCITPVVRNRIAAKKRSAFIGLDSRII